MNGETTGITVRGTGEVVVQPDTGYFDAGIQVTRKTVASARRAAAAAASGLIDRLRAEGVEALDMQTSALSIQPQYRYPKEGGEPSVTGYQVSNQVSITVRALDRFSAVLDAAIVAGGDDVRVSGVRFGLDDERPARSAARAAAMAEAKAAALELAATAEVDLGAPLSINEVGETPVPMPRMARMSLAASQEDVGTPLEAGSETVRVTVVVRYAIET